MSTTTSAKANALRANASAAAATGIRDAAEILFEAGGKKVLDESSRLLIRESVENAASGTLLNGAPQLMGSGIKQLSKGAAKKGTAEITKGAAKGAAKEVPKSVGKDIVKTAAKELGKGIGRASLAGGAIDGLIGTGEGIYKYRTGECSAKEAVVHAAKEAGTGAVASGVGVVAVAVVVALTGPVGWGAAAVIAGGTSVGAKLGLKSLFG